MAVIKCKMCGGDLDLIEGQSVAECEFCGSRQTVPAADNEKKLNLFARANRLRAACDFDKAAGIYEAIVADFPEEAEAYWGLVLCKYGIEYVDDPATGKKIPTCHRSSFDSVMEDSNFEQAMENADEAALRLYRQEAKQMEEIRRGILTVSSSEKPYDIFICYKETDPSGDRTVDSLLAQDIYDALTAKGYRVFFSRITLEDKLGQAYEPYIFAALNSARIMLAVGTCYEHYNAVWVKNEWSRYLKIIAKDKNKYLIPCYRNIDAYDIPKEFAHLQGQDMGKVGAIADLLRGVEKLMPSNAASVIRSALTSQSRTKAPTSDAFVFRGMLALEDKDWRKADQFFEQALNENPKNGNAYLGKLLADLHLQSKAQLSGGNIAFHTNKNYPRILQFADTDMVSELKRYKQAFDTKNEEKVARAIEIIHIYAKSAYGKDKLLHCRVAVQQTEDAVMLAEQKVAKNTALLSDQETIEERIAEAEKYCQNVRLAIAERKAICETHEEEIQSMQAREQEIKRAISQLGWFAKKQKNEYQSQLNEIHYEHLEEKLSEFKKELNNYTRQLTSASAKLKDLHNLARNYQQWNADLNFARAELESAKTKREEALSAQKQAEAELPGEIISEQDAVGSYLTLFLANRIPEIKEELRSYYPKYFVVDHASLTINQLEQIKAYSNEVGGFVEATENGNIVCVYPKDTHNAAAFFNTIVAAVYGKLDAGKEYYLKVKRILPIGAFVGTEMDNMDGFLHISKIANYRIARVEEELNVGDWIRVKYMGADEKGRKNWSHKDIELE